MNVLLFYKDFIIGIENVDCIDRLVTKDFDCNSCIYNNEDCGLGSYTEIITNYVPREDRYRGIRSACLIISLLLNESKMNIDDRRVSRNKNARILFFNKKCMYTVLYSIRKINQGFTAYGILPSWDMVEPVIRPVGEIKYVNPFNKPSRP